MQRAIFYASHTFQFLLVQSTFYCMTGDFNSIIVIPPFCPLKWHVSRTQYGIETIEELIDFCESKIASTSFEG